MNFTPEEREEYEEHLKWLRTEVSGIKKAEQKSFDKGRAEGKAEGKAEGREEGRIDMLKKMKQSGMDNRFISKVTGFSIEVIEKV